MDIFKRIAATLPDSWQHGLKRIYFARQIKKNKFLTDEPEFQILHELISTGDWVIDIGANVGHYTKRLSELVGDKGRVIAVEPVPTTFSLLSSNIQLFNNQNVSLLNVAISNEINLVGMSIPKFSTGLINYYQAHLSPINGSDFSVLAIPLDPLFLLQRITLIKIDAEGHEPHVLEGLRGIIEKYKPVLIVETGSKDLLNDIGITGYKYEKLKESPNILFRPIVS